MTNNRLADASSAYLQSAAHQPIDWYEFGEEAFQAARDKDCLILLDIGAVWCHWCHVIDRESYENPDIADLINAQFVAIKVDRDQRPDIDSRYQQVVQAMTGRGGWPLTAFLTYDGRVLYGGTYFPPHVMKKLLTDLPEIYQKQKADVMAESLDDASAEVIREGLLASEAEQRQERIPADVLTKCLQVAKQVFDPDYGGFGNQPKFPHFSLLALLLQQYVRSGQTELGPMLTQTLTAMAQGGIVDQLAGGFHRYSVDRYWHVPHFEKMAYDNAEALRVYAQAYRAFQDPLYLQTAHGIVQFVMSVLSDPTHGGFYASQDADINLEDDGDYFTWTLAEIDACLPADQAEVIKAKYKVSAAGDMHERPGRNVLRVQASWQELAEQFNVSPESIEATIQTAEAALLQARLLRQTPHIDRTLYLNWNGMMMAACWEAADLLSWPHVASFVQKTMGLLLTSHVDTVHDRLLHCPGVPGLLEDYAWFIHALIQAYQSTGEHDYLQLAERWTNRTCDLFEDAQYGGFFDTEEPNENSLGLLKFRRKPTDDSPSSSANGIMIRNLLQLSVLTDNSLYREKATKALHLFVSALSERSIYNSALLTAFFEWQHPPVKLEITGEQAQFVLAAKQAFYPGRLLSYQPQAQPAGIRVCEGSRCLNLLNDPAKLQDYLQEVVLQHSQ